MSSGSPEMEGKEGKRVSFALRRSNSLGRLDQRLLKEEVRVLQETLRAREDALRMSSQMGKELVDAMKDLRMDKDTLEQQLHQLMKTNSHLVHRLGDIASEKNRLALAHSLIAEENSLRERRVGELSKEAQQLQASLEKSKFLGSSPSPIDTLGTPRDMRFGTPRAGRAFSLPTAECAIQTTPRSTPSPLPKGVSRCSTSQQPFSPTSSAEERPPSVLGDGSLVPDAVSESSYSSRSCAHFSPVAFAYRPSGVPRLAFENDSNLLFNDDRLSGPSTNPQPPLQGAAPPPMWFMNNPSFNAPPSTNASFAASEVEDRVFVRRRGRTPPARLSHTNSPRTSVSGDALSIGVVELMLSNNTTPAAPPIEPAARPRSRALSPKEGLRGCDDVAVCSALALVAISSPPLSLSPACIPILSLAGAVAVPSAPTSPSRRRWPAAKKLESVPTPTMSPPSVTSPLLDSISRLGNSCRSIRSKGKGKSTDASHTPEFTPDHLSDLLERVSHGSAFPPASPALSWGTPNASANVSPRHPPAPTPNSKHVVCLPIAAFAHIDSDAPSSEGECDQQVDPGSATVSPRGITRTLEDYCMPVAPEGKHFELGKWALQDEGKRVPVSDVMDMLTEVADIPHLHDLQKDAELEQQRVDDALKRISCISPSSESEPAALQDFCQSAGTGEGRAIRGGSWILSHATASGLQTILTELLRVVRDVHQVKGGDRRQQVELRMLEKELSVAVARFDTQSTVAFVETLMRDYQNLRTLQGDLAIQLHGLNEETSEERLGACKYQVSLIRQQKVIIRQKAYVLRCAQLREFYTHFSLLLSSVLLILRALMYCPICHVPKDCQELLDVLYEILPQSAVLFECRMSYGHSGESRTSYTSFSLGDIDAAVDAVALTLCKKFEQQLSLVTHSEGVVSGASSAADWCVAVIIESIRMAKADPLFPMADQLVAFVEGVSFTVGETGRGRERVVAHIDPVTPSLDCFRLPHRGQVRTAPPSDHLEWTAEGIFRSSGVRTLHGDLFSFEGEESHQLYGFRTDTAQHAHDLGMSPVKSLCWGSRPSDVWEEDSEFLAHNPILFCYPSPVGYTLVRLSTPSLGPGGLLVAPPEGSLITKDSSGKSTPTWNSRVGPRQ